MVVAAKKPNEPISIVKKIFSKKKQIRANNIVFQWQGTLSSIQSKSSSSKANEPQTKKPKTR